MATDCEHLTGRFISPYQLGCVPVNSETARVQRYPNLGNDRLTHAVGGNRVDIQRQFDHSCTPRAKVR